MTWVRPAYFTDVWPEGDDRQLINLEHYRTIRVVLGSFPSGKGWALQAIVETRDATAVAPPQTLQGTSAILAAVPTEDWANELFRVLRQQLAGGHALIDLRAELPKDERDQGTPEA